ncbi:hypothetical protein HMPREF1155_1614 [Slackia sp. CM382]|nr:hypothetical protein HMPREF1155_1614 [Slackia sp. CM382]
MQKAARFHAYVSRRGWMMPPICRSMPGIGTIGKSWHLRYDRRDEKF